jgi:hypothetical protein
MKLYQKRKVKLPEGGIFGEPKNKKDKHEV